MKFGQLIEYNMSNIFLQKENVAKKLYMGLKKVVFTFVFIYG